MKRVVNSVERLPDPSEPAPFKKQKSIRDMFQRSIITPKSIDNSNFLKVICWNVAGLRSMVKNKSGNVTCAYFY